MVFRRSKKKVVVERYESEKEYEKKSEKMLEDGYEVADVQTEEQGRGCLKWATLGLFALFTSPKHEYVVTYRLVEEEES